MMARIEHMFFNYELCFNQMRIQEKRGHWWNNRPSFWGPQNMGTGVKPKESMNLSQKMSEKLKKST